MREEKIAVSGRRKGENGSDFLIDRSTLKLIFFSVLECGEPASVAHSKYTLVNGTRRFKSVVHYECAPGHLLVGRNDLMCDVDERWNGPPPRCDSVYCDEPQHIRRGGYSLSTNSTRCVMNSLLSRKNSSSLVIHFLREGPLRMSSPLSLSRLCRQRSMALFSCWGRKKQSLDCH